jgi:hypothetical protein
VPGVTTVLTRRELNRATLARQHLLAPAAIGALGMVEHLAGLQGQAPGPPYTGLWTRLAGFAGEDLSRLIESREVVRMTLMRGTVHVVSAAHAASLRPLTEPAHQATVARAYAADLAGIDTGKLAAHVRELVEAAPRTPAELAAALGERWPGRAAQALTNAASAWTPLVQTPPRGLWKRGGQPRLTTFEHWTGRPLDPRPAMDDVVLRFLAAFGPASVRDVQKWLGQARLGAVLERLRARLVTFRDEAGAELFDLPDAPRPGAGVPAPVRFLPDFDNVLLAYAGFDRVMDPAHKRTIFTVNGRILGTVLVGGFAAATWRVDAAKGTATLAVTPLVPIAAADRDAVTAEGTRLLAFLADDADRREVVIREVGRGLP